MNISDLQVMKSAAGYYIGRGYREDFMPEGMYPLPYSRDSEYFEFEDAARIVLQCHLDMLAADEDNYTSHGE